MADTLVIGHAVRSWIGVCLIVVALAASSRPAQAVVGGPITAEASLDIALIACSTGFWCALLGLDPTGSDITSISFTLNYDPAKITINDGLSGFLCDFSSGGDCPTPHAQTGLVYPSLIPTPTAGGTLPGTTATITDDKVNGVFSVSYNLSANPVHATSNQEFFGIFLQGAMPGPPPAFQFFDAPGSYDVTQVSFACSTTLSTASTETCGSDTPIRGFNLVPVPEPSTMLLLALGLAGLGLLRRAAFRSASLESSTTRSAGGT